MPSSYSTRSRLTKPATGELSSVWGETLNSGVFELIDAAMDGWTTVSATGTLTTANGASDEARKRVLKFTGAYTATIPSVEKVYLVWAYNGDATVTNGASSVTVKSGNVALVITDGTTVAQGVFSDFGAVVPKTTTNPTTDDHLTRKAWVAAQIAAASFAPGGPGGDGTVLTSQGGAIVWDTLAISLIPGLQEALDDKADIDEVYTTSETDDLLNAKAPKASPALTGNPTAPTQTLGDDSTKIATTAFVQANGPIKAAIFFEGSSGAALASRNASVVRSSAGAYTVTLSPAMANTNYGVLFGSFGALSTGEVVRIGGAKTINGFQIAATTPAGTSTDPGEIYCAVVAL